MEIQVRVVRVLPEQSGISSLGKQWTKQEFIGETQDQFPKSIFFTAFNPRNKYSVPAVGEVVTVSFDVESKSFQGKDGSERWYTNCNVWNVRVDGQVANIADTTAYVQPPQVANAPQVNIQQSPQPTSDLPF